MRLHEGVTANLNLPDLKNSIVRNLLRTRRHAPRPKGNAVYLSNDLITSRGIHAPENNDDNIGFSPNYLRHFGLKPLIRGYSTGA